VDARLQGADGVRQLLNAMHGGSGPNGEVGFRVTKGVLFENLLTLGQTKLMSDEEMDHYVQQYMLQPAPQLRGPLNWYRARVPTYEEEIPLAKAGKQLDMPALFVQATRDKALPAHMSVGMEKHFKNLTRAEVNSSHWALTHASDEVNALLAKWIEGVMDRGFKASL
jgi:soluble epoxide hydrolase / lipid-phosphate phosphatase